MLEIQKFISDNPNWREILTNEPYSLIINQTDDRIIFRYMQGISDYSYPLVREARGLILDANDFHVVSMGFTKFFLHDSEFADTIDWQSVRIEDKADGSLIVLYYYNNQWIPATTGTIDAHMANNDWGDIDSFGTLFDMAAKNVGLDYSKLNTDYCYMFELVSPYNRLVVPYDETKLIHIGTRDRITLKELDTNIDVEKPKLYEIKNLDDAISAVNDVNFHGEGFVVVDKDYHRIKVKSDEWFKWHYMIANNHINIERGLEILLSDDADEFTAQFPHYKNYIEKIKRAYDNYIDNIKYTIKIAKRALSKCGNRKEFAEYYFSYLNIYIHPDDKKYHAQYKDAYFKVFDNHDYTYKDYLKDDRYSHMIKTFTNTYNRMFKN